MEGGKISKFIIELFFPSKVRSAIEENKRLSTKKEICHSLIPLDEIKISIISNNKIIKRRFISYF